MQNAAIPQRSKGGDVLGLWYSVYVADERFDYAQNCKEAGELLQKAGLRLGKYEIEKRLAIEEENYDRAKQKKDHIEEYKQAVMESLKVEQLMEDDGVSIASLSVICGTCTPL